MRWQDSESPHGRRPGPGARRPEFKTRLCCSVPLRELHVSKPLLKRGKQSPCLWGHEEMSLARVCLAAGDEQ